MEVVSHSVLQQTGLPINPERFSEVYVQTQSPGRAYDAGGCVTKDESLAARVRVWDLKPQVFRELQ